MKDLYRAILGVLTESNMQPSLHDLAHEHAGIHWNNEEARDTYANHASYKKAEARRSEIEQHVEKHHGPEALKHVKAFSEHMVPVLNHEHGLDDEEYDSTPELSHDGHAAAKALGIQPSAHEAINHAYSHQKWSVPGRIADQ